MIEFCLINTQVLPKCFYLKVIFGWDLSRVGVFSKNTYILHTHRCFSDLSTHTPRHTFLKSDKFAQISAHGGTKQ